MSLKTLINNLLEKQALDIVSKDIHIQIKEIHQWTDGCAAQYKGKKSFAEISLRNKPSVCRFFFRPVMVKTFVTVLGYLISIKKSRLYLTLE
jgi:hypothetical protein